MTSNTSNQSNSKEGSDLNQYSFGLRLALLAASSLTVMAGATMSPSLPAMQSHFHDVPDVAYWVKLLLTLPALFIALFAPVAGWVADRFGRKRLLFLTVLLYGLSGTAGFFLDSLTAILISRAILGMSVAGVITSATALISDYFQGSARARFLGFQAAFMGFGGVVFLLAGGALSEWSWRGPFLVYASALALVPLIALSVFEPDRKSGYSKALPDDPQSLHLPIIGFILFFAFSGMVVFYLIPVQLPFFLEKRFGAAGFITGASIALATLVASICSLNFAHIRRHFSHLMICVLIYGFMGIGYLIFGSAGNIVQAWGGLIICGLGFGMLMPNLNLWVAAVTPEAFRGRVVGALGAAIFLGQFFSPVITEPLRGAAGLDLLYEGAGVALLLAAALIFGLVLLRKHRKKAARAVSG